MTTDDRITARRAQLQQQRDAIPDDGTLPASTTRDELAQVQQQRLDAERRLTSFDATVAAWRALGSTETDEHWRDQLTAWREELCEERKTIKSPIRDPREKGRERNLALSIRCIDLGARVFDDTGYDLTTLRLGALMRAAGYDVVGADPAHNFTGTMPWHGSLPDVEKRLETLAARRAQAEANLEAVLLSDEERATQEAEAKQLQDAFNAMTVKIGDDGALVAYTDDGEVFELSKMTALQRRAFERMDALHPRRVARAEPVTS